MNRMQPPQRHPDRAAQPAPRHEKRLRQWEHRPEPARPLFPEPDPPIYKPMG